jgi:hypothetical protein
VEASTSHNPFGLTRLVTGKALPFSMYCINILWHVKELKEIKLKLDKLNKISNIAVVETFGCARRDE